jgi:hypothetical protein
MNKARHRKPLLSDIDRWSSTLNNRYRMHVDGLSIRTVIVRRLGTHATTIGGRSDMLKNNAEALDDGDSCRARVRLRGNASRHGPSSDRSQRFPTAIARCVSVLLLIIARE